MTTSVATRPAPLPPAIPEHLADVAEFVAESLAPATRRAYAAGWSHFSAWCEGEGAEALPATPETVARYLAASAKAGSAKVSTLRQRLAAIRHVHRSRRFESPTADAGVLVTMRGIRRKLGVAPKRKAPATADRVRLMASHTPEGLKGLRDRALLLFGFMSAMRRSELVGLEVADLQQTERGLYVTLRRSKTDQEGEGKGRGVPFGRAGESCPVEALLTWLAAAGITEGRVFRRVNRHGQIGESLSTNAVADVVKRYAEAAGLDPADYAGHSLRRGWATSAAENGAPLNSIREQGGWKTLAMPTIYIDHVDIFADHPGSGLL